MGRPEVFILKTTIVKVSLFLCISALIFVSIRSEDGLLHPDPMEFSSPRFEGDSMVAGLNISKATSMAIKIYDWHTDFRNAYVQGLSGERVQSIYVKAKPTPARVIILFAGFNNVKRSDESVESIINAYARALARYQQLSGNVYCIGIPPMVHSKSDDWYPEGAGIDNVKILDVNSGINALCGDNYIDTPSFWTESDTDDGIHPNLQGYNKIVADLKGRKWLVFQVWLSDLVLWVSGSR